jgi:hypothetical protein
MANTISRLLPFRQYSEQEVINFYSLDEATGEAGSLVRVSSANLDLDPVQYTTRGDANAYANTLGHATSLYPSVPYKVTKVTGTGDFLTGGALGIMLRDVRTVDENGQNLLFYPQKKEELQCVVSGEAVPVAAKGVFTFTQNAFVNGATARPAVNDWVVPATNGLLTGVGTVALKTTYANFKVGTVLATGTRESTQDTDFATGFYAMVKIDL